MLTWLKRLGIKFVRKVNDRLDPFDEFNRRPLPADDLKLFQKASSFFNQIQAGHDIGGFFIYRMSYPGEEWDYGDQCLWQGMYAAMLAFRQHSEPFKMQVADLFKAVNAMAFHHRGPRNYLIRGVNPGDLVNVSPESATFKEEVSNDSATGHLFGVYHAYLAGDTAIKDACRWMAAMLAEEIINNDYALVNQNRSKTKYGRLIQGPITDPHRAALALAILYVAWRLTGLKRYEIYFDDVFKSFGGLLRCGEVKFLWLTKTHEAHRVMMNLSILAGYHERPLCSMWAREGMVNTLSQNRKAANPWLIALASSVFPERLKQSGLDLTAKGRLSEFSVDRRSDCAERLNSQNEKQWNNTHGIRFFEYDGKLRASQPLPFNLLGNQDFFFQRDLYSVDNYQGSTDTRPRYTGLDYLVAYWLLLKNGMVGAQE